MRTNIFIDDNLMAEALKVSGYNTKKKTVEEALKLLINLKKQADIRTFRGKLHWEGDLNTLRTDK
jgi:Arc/MetJ family transcription regulator